MTALRGAGGCFLLMLRQGFNLAKAKDSLKHGQWAPWALENLPFTIRTAQNRIVLYLKYSKQLNAKGISFLRGGQFDASLLGEIKDEDIKAFYEAAGLIKKCEQLSLVSSDRRIPVEACFQRLNFLSEWVTQNRETVFTSWEPLKRQELKDRIKPLVELYNVL